MVRPVIGFADSAFFLPSSDEEGGALFSAGWLTAIDRMVEPETYPSSLQAFRLWSDQLPIFLPFPRGQELLKESRGVAQLLCRRFAGSREIVVEDSGARYILREAEVHSEIPGRIRNRQDKLWPPLQNQP